MKHYDRIYAAIDLDAVSHNMDILHRHLEKETKIVAVVKTDGYGHGAVPIARELESKEYLYGFATATAEEALCLRKAGVEKPLLVLGYVFPYAFEELVREDIRFTLFREDMIDELNEEAGRQGKEAVVHIKVDTGMSRIGIRPDEEGIAFLEKVYASPNLKVEGMFTHFARADEEDKGAAYQQFARFTSFCRQTEEHFGVNIPIKHCANSAAILEMPDVGMDMVRAGISLYGMWPWEGNHHMDLDLRPAFSLHSHIVFLKKLEAGREISYGGTYVTRKEMQIATIPVGYGDGYPRTLSGKGYVLVHGKKAPILGRICMDQFMVDVTHIPEAKEGDEVILIGRDGQEHITMEELGELAERFNYELACVIGKRVPRIYSKGGKECYAKDYFDDYYFEKI
ncbi:MAG: alanine racemase [Lachnospiraceae bacterium]|nr:alanine racemase [Lachnospiraceae bacterium]